MLSFFFADANVEEVYESNKMGLSNSISKIILFCILPHSGPAYHLRSSDQHLR